MFTDILNEAYLILRLSLIVGIMELIVFGITKNSPRRYLICFIASIIILFIYSGLFFLDYYLFGTNFRPKVYMYFIIISLIFVFLFLSVLIAKNKHNKYRVISEPKKKMIYTVHNKNEYIYCFAKGNEYIYLLDGTYTGIKYHLKKKEFCDDAIQKVLKSFGDLDYLDLRRNGIVTHKGEKEDDVYYCYMIELNSDIEMKGFKKISLLDISNLNIDRIDKFIILKCLTESDFTDTI